VTAPSNAPCCSSFTDNRVTESWNFEDPGAWTVSGNRSPRTEPGLPLR
jgi:hypothetical protein